MKPIVSCFVKELAEYDCSANDELWESKLLWGYCRLIEGDYEYQEHLHELLIDDLELPTFVCDEILDKVYSALEDVLFEVKLFAEMYRVVSVDIDDSLGDGYYIVAMTERSR